MVEGNYFAVSAEKVEENYSAESAETFERQQGLARIACTCRGGHTCELLRKVTRGFEAFEPDKGKYYY